MFSILDGRSERATRQPNVLRLKRYSVKMFSMSGQAKRSTIYLEPELYKAVRVKAAHSHRSISDIVNDSLRSALREDQEDLEAFEKRASEPVMSYESLLKKLKADGKI